MADIYVKSGAGTQNSGTYRGIWLTAGNWAVGDRVVAVNLVSYRVHECTTAGAGDAAEPTWNTATAGTTTMAAGAVFTTRIPSTWANATVDLVRVAANDAAGDRIFTSQAHVESTAAAVTIALAGTIASPSLVICGNDAAEPPTALSTAGAVTSTGTSNITISGAAAYVYGLTFNIGTGAGSSSLLYTSEGKLHLHECNINLVGSGTSGRVNIGNNANIRSHAHLQNVDVTFAATAQGLLVSGGSLIWEGGGVASGSAATALFKSASGNSRGSKVLLSGLDLSGCAASVVIFAAGGSSPYDAVMRNCKLPASWSGSLSSGTFAPGQRFEMYNCDSADTNYRTWVEDEAGSLVTDDALYRAPGLGASSWMYSGATQVVGISNKYRASANAEYPLIGFVGVELTGLNTTINPTTSHVVSCFFTTPGQADFTPLSNKDIGLLVQYPGVAGSPQGKFSNDLVAGVLTTEADQDADTVGDWDDALGAWVALTAYAVGAVVRPVTRNGKTYYCSVAGTTGAVEPTWSTTEGNANTDATATWRCMHRQKMVVTLDATAGKVQERGWLHLTPVMYLASAVAWVDPQASVTSS